MAEQYLHLHLSQFWADIFWSQPLLNVLISVLVAEVVAMVTSLLFYLLRLQEAPVWLLLLAAVEAVEVEVEVVEILCFVPVIL